ncbi:hypothetical protein NEIELOOT_01212 [Neisseria elongata subsp. glycolytica ATCC 29315]|uniref:Uncharacterized protein n=1 Tax=Neisseria elongata subsp. glycolytica ATCC 29315 TaxID=546263 RepID=D4DQ76_NEIEG|nr:hypothetical protein NEIELOOT_01212 [Neisseria elongata subsp. glycolytica ATCC 29315]
MRRWYSWLLPIGSAFRPSETIEAAVYTLFRRPEQAAAPSSAPFFRFCRGKRRNFLEKIPSAFKILRFLRHTACRRHFSNQG